jgi:hypothetical protein
MGEGGGDEEEDGESEDDDEDSQGTGLAPTHSLTHPYIYTFLCFSHTNTL